MNLFWNTSQSIFFQDPTLIGKAWRSLPDGRRVGILNTDDPLPPSYDSRLKPKTLVDRLQFGDGYEQITESGIRSQKLIFDLRWTALEDEKARAIQRFLTGEGENSIYFRRPSEWFWWLPPKSLRTNSTLPIKVICVDNWEITPTTWNSNNVSATFEESFMV